MKLQDPNIRDDMSFADKLEVLLPELRAFARGLCKNADLADDMVQDTCLKAWAAADSFHTDAPMRPWLFRILRNEFYQYTRRAWRSTELEPEQAERTLIAAESLESKSDFRLMQAAIDALPQNQREALILVVAAGFTYEEAGIICDCADGTIKSRVSRARETVMYAMSQAAIGRGPLSGLLKPDDVRGLEDLLADIDALAIPPTQAA